MPNGDTRIFYVGELIRDIGKVGIADNIPAAYWRIMGQIRGHSDFRTLRRGDNKIIVVSDGLVLSGEGSDGYVLLNKTTDQWIE